MTGSAAPNGASYQELPKGVSYTEFPDGFEATISTRSISMTIVFTLLTIWIIRVREDFCWVWPLYLPWTAALLFVLNLLAIFLAGRIIVTLQAGTLHVFFGIGRRKGRRFNWDQFHRVDRRTNRDKYRGRYEEVSLRGPKELYGAGDLYFGFFLRKEQADFLFQLFQRELSKTQQ